MDSDEEYEYTPSWRGVPGTIILINIFQNSKLHTFQTSHAAICRSVRRCLRSPSSQVIGVCIYGRMAESDSSVLDTKSLDEVIPLSTPTLDEYKKLKNIDITCYKEATELVLSEVLWHCSKMFSNCKRQLSSKTVIMLTPLHIPPVETDKKPTLSRIEDIVDSNIDLRIVNVGEVGHIINPFYEKFLTKANKGINYELPQPVQDSLEIEQLIEQENHPHLSVAKMNFEIGNNMEIGVGVYALLKRAGQSYHKITNLNRESNSIVTSVTKTMKVDVDLDQQNDYEDSPTESKQVPILKSELLYYQEYGGERVEFTDTELKSIRNPFGPPNMKLLGFKPASLMCKEKWFLKMGYFLFPNESIIEGSTVAFKALHKACQDMAVVAICSLCTRVNAKPVVVALSPCSNPLNNKVEIGFDLIIIPFIESVRDININEDDEDDEGENVDTGKKMLMKEIVNQIKFDYKPDMFENPKLQSEYRALEEIALDNEDFEPFVDTTKPTSDKFQNITDDLFEELFGPFGTLPLKRAAPKTSHCESKKSKVDIDDDLLHAKINNKTIHEFTVLQLKDILKAKNIEKLPALTGLKKMELVELIYKYVK